MTDLKIGLKLEGDSSGAVAATKAETDELKRLDAAADTAAASAQRMATGLGAIETRARSAAAATAAQINQSLNVKSDFGGAARAADIEAYGAALDQTRARINPFVAAQQQFLGRQTEINDAVRLGAVTETEAARAHDLNNASYRRTLSGLSAVTAATRTHTGAVKLQGYQIANLGQQMQDVGVQLAMGTNPFMIMAQQGPQITSAMGGVKNSLALIKPLFTTTRVAIAGVTAALAVGASAWSSYLTSVKAVQTAAAGRGRGLGFSDADLQDIAQSSAKAAGISIKSAREAEVAFLNTGKIGKDVIGGLIGLSKDYATTMGVDLSAAFDELAGKFADPAKAAEAYQKSLDLLDDRTLRYIQTLVLQNRATEAQLVLQNALRGRLVPAGDGLTALGRAWNSFGNSVSNAYDRLGSGVDGLFNQADASQKYLDELTAARQKAQQSFSGQALLAGVGILDLGKLDSEINRVRGRLDQLRREEDQKKINFISTRAGDTGRALTPGANELDQLRQQQSNLRPALHDPAVAAASADIVQIATAYERATSAINSYITPTQRATAVEQLAIEALTARTPAAKADIAARQKRLELQGQALTAGEREAQVAAASTLAFRTATQAIIDQNATTAINTRGSLDLAKAWLTGADAAQRAEARRTALSEALQTGADVEVQTRLHLAAAVADQAVAGAQSVISLNNQADAQARLNAAMLQGGKTQAQASVSAERDAALKPLITARDNASGEAKKVLTAIIDRLTAAYDRLNAEQSRGAAADIIQSQKDEIAQVKTQIGLFGQSAKARAEGLAVIQAKQTALGRNVELGSVEGQQIVENAIKLADYNLVLARQNDLYGELGNFGERSLDKINDAIIQNGLSLKTLRDVTKSVIADMASEFLKLAALNPLKNALFGGNYGTLADAGGLIGSLFNAGAHHDGGLVGKQTMTRQVSPAVFKGAPRFHNGGLVSGERPIIAMDDEEVLTTRDPRHRFNLGKASGGTAAMPNVNIANNINLAPGLTAKTQTSTDGNGNVSIDTFVEKIEDRMADRGKSGQGNLFPAMASTYGLDAGAGRARSGR